MNEIVRLRTTQLHVNGRVVVAGAVLQVLRRFETSGGWRLALGDDLGRVVLPQVPPERCETLIRRLT